MKSHSLIGAISLAEPKTIILMLSAQCWNVLLSGSTLQLCSKCSWFVENVQSSLPCLKTCGDTLCPAAVDGGAWMYPVTVTLRAESASARLLKLKRVVTKSGGAASVRSADPPPCEVPDLWPGSVPYRFWPMINVQDYLTRDVTLKYKAYFSTIWIVQCNFSCNLKIVFWGFCFLLFI